MDASKSFNDEIKSARAGIWRKNEMTEFWDVLKELLI
jgi:hypothetical protein